jgi:hypothetical protein
MANKSILLIEPGYRNKYPPLGLMKIAQYHGPRGKGDKVIFVKGCDRSVLSKSWDRIYVTTLFSFEYEKISETIDFALEAAFGHADRVFVGGIAASLMHERFITEPRWAGIRFIKGLLTAPPADALQLDEFSDELYSDDRQSTPIEDLIPDYSILKQIKHRYPAQDAYFAYASRGCIRKCSFCGVPKLEGAQRAGASISEIVRQIDELYGAKKDLLLMDNNVAAAPNFKEIIAEIRDLGFVPGAKLARGRMPALRRVDFNQGVDARILCKDAMYLRELSSICLKPLRIAFDHLGLRSPYEKAIRYAHQFGLTELSNYMLYNFHDTPSDLFERMRLNVALNEELNIRIWSFPMRYQPTNLPDRSHIGQHWTRYQLRSLQVILQATRGIVSGAPDFFKRAFGNTHGDFEDLLLWPHKFIFNRDWYEKFDGLAELDEFKTVLARIGTSDRRELLTLLSSVDPKDYHSLFDRTPSEIVRRALHFYLPMSKEDEREIWRLQRERIQAPDDLNCELQEDEIVEDAGLGEERESKLLVA